MATQAQINANRLNAQKSTGPRSVEGKTSTRFNALKSGINALSLVIPGENPEDFEALTRSFHEQFRPVNPLEAHFVETLARCSWTSRRLRVIEAQTINAMLREEDAPNPLGAAILRDAEGPNALDKIYRHQNAQERAFHRALKELRLLQADRPPEPEPEPDTEAVPQSLADTPAEAASEMETSVAQTIRPTAESAPIAFPRPGNWVGSANSSNRPSTAADGDR
jgi:hypothetical protein